MTTATITLSTINSSQPCRVQSIVQESQNINNRLVSHFIKLSISLRRKKYERPRTVRCSNNPKKPKLSYQRLIPSFFCSYATHIACMHACMHACVVGKYHDRETETQLDHDDGNACMHSQGNPLQAIHVRALLRTLMYYCCPSIKWTSKFTPV